MSSRFIAGDSRSVLETLESESVQCCIKSPPYFGLRSYNGGEAEIGTEQTLTAYVESLVEVFREVRRVLRKDGTAWLNIGDTFAASRGGAHMPAQTVAGGVGGRGHEPTFRGTGGETARHAHRDARSHGMKHKDLMMVPARVAIALRDDGWWLRSDIIWAKPNPMPESVRDRPTSAHEHIFLLTRSERYYYDADAIAEPAVRGYAGSTFTDGKTGANGQGRVGSGIRFGGTKAADSIDRSKSGNEWIDRTGTRNKRNVWMISTKGFKGWSEVVRVLPASGHEVDGGTRRIPSRDCSVHGSGDRSDPRIEYGGYEGHPTVRTGGNGHYLAFGQRRDSARIVQHHDGSLSPESWDSLLPSYAPIATAHNNRMSRTDRDPVTNQPCMPSAQTADGTGDRSMSPASDGLLMSTAESNKGWVDLSSATAAQNVDRSADMSSCLCLHYRRTSESISHFAVMPEALVEPCILAGTRPGDTVIDPFSGAGTVALVAAKNGRSSIGIDLNPEYVEMSRRRLATAGFDSE